MVITISVMPPFTYPDLSLCSHGVITILCDLQIFLCPTNEDVTRVHYATSLDIGTSGVLMTSSRLFTTLRPPVRGWPSVQSPLAPGILLPIRFSLGSIQAMALPCDRLPPAKNMKVYCRCYHKVNVR
jgi:hypothetical protein